MKGPLPFKTWKGEKWVGRWVGVFYFKWSSCLLVLTKHLSGSTMMQRPLVHQNQVFLPNMERKLSHFLMPPFLKLWTSLTLLLSYQPCYCSECPDGQALWRCTSFLRSSSCCCWNFSSVVRHNLIQPYSLLLLLTHFLKVKVKLLSRVRLFATHFLVLANTPSTNS